MWTSCPSSSCPQHGSVIHRSTWQCRNLFCEKDLCISCLKHRANRINTSPKRKRGKYAFSLARILKSTSWLMLITGCRLFVRSVLPSLWLDHLRKITPSELWHEYSLHLGTRMSNHERFLSKYLRRRLMTTTLFSLLFSGGCHGKRLAP